MPRVTGKKGLCGENEIDSSVQDFRRRGMVFMTNISVLEKKLRVFVTSGEGEQFS
jgi:hypothetical protein